MPTVKLTISKKFDRNEKENLALELTALVAKEIGKPETVTQAIVADDAIVSFGGTGGQGGGFPDVEESPRSEASAPGNAGTHPESRQRARLSAQSSCMVDAEMLSRVAAGSACPKNSGYSAGSPSSGKVHDVSIRAEKTIKHNLIKGI
jgi:hypothetical protein